MKYLYSCIFFFAALSVATAGEKPGLGVIFEVHRDPPCLEDVCAENTVVSRVFVGAVACMGPASKAGVRSGDFVARINDVALHGQSIPEFEEIMQSIDLSHDVKLDILRQESGGVSARTFIVTPRAYDDRKACEKEHAA